MSASNKTLRIRTEVGKDTFIPLKLDNEYEVLEILSLKISQKGEYRYHTSQDGIIVGRVLANNGFGVPNAKLSLFIPREDTDDIFEAEYYPYSTVGSKNKEGVRYNLLPSNQRDNCHQVVGTFPSKRGVLDDNRVIEVFDKYYKYTTTTNDAGDYMFYGVPVGTYMIHMDLDISDCGKLSQRPRDFIYKGYTIEQFENPNQFKTDTELSALSQIFTQDIAVEVKPFWGDSNEGTEVGITRSDINVQFKFEPTCVFMGSIVSDKPTEGISKKCVPTNKMGDMRDLVTGHGTIEIIRKKIDNTVEELQIKGKQLINGNGVWCFQIPMNLDYVTTDEFGNTVPTDNPEKGIPTRCEVRFRLSMDDGGANINNKYSVSKVLVPHNPMNENELDYEFGSKTKETSFKSLMWNNVYSIKSFIPRFQKSKQVKTDRFSGIKNVNIHGQNNPMPYNNIRIRLPFMFWLVCNLAKIIINIIKVINDIKVALMSVIGNIGFTKPYTYLSNGLCPDLEYWYFAPGMNTRPANAKKENRECLKWEEESVCLTFKRIVEDIMENDLNPNDNEINLTTYVWDPNDDSEPNPAMPQVLSEYEFKTSITRTNNKKGSYYNKKNWTIATGTTQVLSYPKDTMSTEVRNALSDNNKQIRIKLTDNVNYLMQCLEMSLAQEYEVIKFDFYNDWLNGVVYLPRWMREVKYRRRRRNGEKYIEERVKGCINNLTTSRVSRRYVQQCSLAYDQSYKLLGDNVGCSDKNKLRCHKKDGMDYVEVFGNKKGVVEERKTFLGDNVYYMKPWEFRTGGRRIPLFATDIIMLGSLLDCNEYGLPSVFDSYVTTSYQMPTNMALTNLDEDSYAYNIDTTNTSQSGDGYVKNIPPTIGEIESWACGKKCDKRGIRATGGIVKNPEKQIPSYDDINGMLQEYENIYDTGENGKIRFEYEDIFPVTEMSGIEWGFTGPAQINSDEDISDDKMFAPGGHFMGLACSNAETNFRSCVNLKRACEIGTTLSTRYEIPIDELENVDENKFDIVQYLYVSPSGLISREQINDVTIRSVFATMNQNSLRTVINPITNFKEYDFMYLLPDSFDGSLRDFVSKYQSYNKQIALKHDEYWDKYLNNNAEGEYAFKVETGNTIVRTMENRSDDYNLFRWGEKPAFLKSNKMPIYLNSFYFYFGLINGNTALDELKSQYFASCGVSNLIQQTGRVEYSVEILKDSYKTFKYDVNINIIGIASVTPMSWQLIGDEYKYNGTTRVNNFTAKSVKYGKYVLVITNDSGLEIREEVIVGNGFFTIDMEKESVVDYKYKCNSDDTIADYIDKKGTNGGFIKGTFAVKINTNSKYDGYTTYYCVEITNGKGSIRNINDNNWSSLKDENGLWLFGPGTYSVYLYYTDSKNDKILYNTFNVNDGRSVEDVIKLSCGSEKIPYSSLYGNGFLNVGWCNSINTLYGVKNNTDYPIDINNNKFGYQYYLYKAIVNQNRKEVPFSIGIYSESDTEQYTSVFVGQKELEDKNGNWKLEEEMSILENFESIHVFDRKKHLYYTARSNGLYATNTWSGTINGNQITGIKGIMIVNGTNDEISEYVGSGQYFLCVQNEDKEIVYCQMNGKNCTVSGCRFKEGEVRLVHMVELNVLSNPIQVQVSVLETFEGGSEKLPIPRKREIVSPNIDYSGFDYSKINRPDIQNKVETITYSTNIDEKNEVVFEENQYDSFGKNIDFLDDAGTFTYINFATKLIFKHTAKDDNLTLLLKDVDPTYKDNYAYYYRNSNKFLEIDNVKDNVEYGTGEYSFIANNGNYLFEYDDELTNNYLEVEIPVSNFESNPYYSCYGVVKKILENSKECDTSLCLLGRNYGASDNYPFNFNYIEKRIILKNMYNNSKKSKWIWYDENGDVKEDYNNKKTCDLISLLFESKKSFGFEILPYKNNDREGIVVKSDLVSTDNGYIDLTEVGKEIFNGKIYYNENTKDYDKYILKVFFGPIEIKYSAKKKQTVESSKSGIQIYVYLGEEDEPLTTPYSGDDGASFYLTHEQLEKIEYIEFRVVDNISKSDSSNIEGDEDEENDEPTEPENPELPEGDDENTEEGTN